MEIKIFFKFGIETLTLILELLQQLNWITKDIFNTIISDNFDIILFLQEMKIREIIIMHDDDEGSYSIQRSSSVNIPVVCSKSIVVGWQITFTLNRL